MRCPDCNHENRAGVLICTNCGADLYDSLMDRIATKKLTTRKETQELGVGIEGEPASSNPIVLYISTEGDKPLTVNRLNEQYVGRINPETGDTTEVDLTDYDAEGYGVSRRHARFDAENEPPMLVDLGSFNGTFVNGQQLTPQRPHPLESGDEVRLGRLIMHVYYK